eukprot:7361947-Lingulodinium_polyedra.AAC.1
MAEAEGEDLVEEELRGRRPACFGDGPQPVPPAAPQVERVGLVPPLERAWDEPARWQRAVAG